MKMKVNKKAVELLELAASDGTVLMGSYRIEQAAAFLGDEYDDAIDDAVAAYCKVPFADGKDCITYELAEAALWLKEGI